MRAIRLTGPAHRLNAATCALLLSSALCSTPITPAHADADSIPPLVTHATFVPPEAKSSLRDTFSLVASNIPVDELLPALAKKAGLNLDMPPGITGSNVTMNLTHRPLPEILGQISAQTGIQLDIRDGHTLAVAPRINRELARR
ncbi:MAG: EsaB/YukD family protein [Magnetococcus sp. YQC-9]